MVTVKLLILSGLTRNEGKDTSQPGEIWEANEMSRLQLGEVKREETIQLLHPDKLVRKGDVCMVVGVGDKPQNT